MAATLTQERFTGPDWLFERKLDGIRLLAFKQGPTVTLYSRNRLPQNHHYPTVVEAIAKQMGYRVIENGGDEEWIDLTFRHHSVKSKPNLRLVHSAG